LRRPGHDEKQIERARSIGPEREKRRCVPSGGRHPLHHPRSTPTQGWVRLFSETEGHDRLGATKSIKRLVKARSYHLALASRAAELRKSPTSPGVCRRWRATSRSDRGRKAPRMGPAGKLQPLGAVRKSNNSKLWPRAASGGRNDGPRRRARHVSPPTTEVSYARPRLGTNGYPDTVRYQFLEHGRIDPQGQATTDRSGFRCRAADGTWRERGAPSACALQAWANSDWVDRWPRPTNILMPQTGPSRRLPHPRL